MDFCSVEFSAHECMHPYSYLVWWSGWGTMWRKQSKCMGWFIKKLVFFPVSPCSTRTSHTHVVDAEYTDDWVLITLAAWVCQNVVNWNWLVTCLWHIAVAAPGGFLGFLETGQLCSPLIFTAQRSATHAHWLLAVRIQGEILFAQLFNIGLRFNLWRPDFLKSFLGGMPPDPPK